LLLLPRDHQKSALVAYRVAWEVTKNPAIRILYISSTANLATKQLKFIKDILTSPIYKYYWPEMVNSEEGRREKWTETEIAVDHPLRKKEFVRDPTIFTAGLTTSITGLHCDVAVLDDVVVRENAYTDEGREKCKQQYSLLSSIEGTGSREWVVGTRYHPRDLYNEMREMEVEIYDDVGDIIGTDPLYEVLQRQVEDRGDGTGQFLWPRQQREDGRWFGFDRRELAKKRAQYLDKIQFRAQYYNDPTAYDQATIKREYFGYYDQKFLQRLAGRWYFKDRRLNVFASVDFAYSKRSRADYTAITVVGVDRDYNYYVLDIDRFKTDQISEYFQRILALHVKWDFRKLIAEVTAAQDVIVKDLKNSYIARHGLALAVEDFRPTRELGSKEERMEAILQPRYANRQILHYRGGNCQLLEEELVTPNPPHDDIKDSLATCINACVAPTANMSANSMLNRPDYLGNNRFGGVL
jgi:phage terminase large subunit-like protein